MFELDNYTLTEKIYEGQHTTVYRAYHTEKKQSFIIKKIDKYSEPRKIAQLHHEYEMINGLELPNIIKLHELKKNNQGWFLVCEDIQGDSLKNILTSRKIDLLTFLNIALQLANGLTALHIHHIIHKDIKPANIIVNLNTGQTKITDFSISSRLSIENQLFDSQNLFEGTLIYISPEQTGRMNRAVDYRTDFYSLGVVFYEMLVGHPPFQSTDALEIVHYHIAKHPPEPHILNQRIPKTLSLITMKLLEKTAEERYQSAQGLKADLQKCLDQLKTLGHIEEFPCGQQDLLDKLQIPQKLYGRDLEIFTLSRAFLRVNRGITEVILISGYAGIGKSALAREIYKPVTQSHGYFITGKFDQLQRNIPYSALVNAFTDLVRQLLTESELRLNQWRQRILNKLGANSQVIIDVIPELELIIGSQSPLPTLESVKEQNRFHFTLKQFFQIFCQPEHPLVVFLDDLQWIDTATLKLFELILTDTENQALLLIGAYRDNEVDSTHPLKIALENLKQAGILYPNEIILTTLNIDHVTQLLAETLHVAQEIVKPLAKLIYKKTAGNPFFIGQLLNKIHEDKLLYFQNRQWQWSLEEINNQDFTDNVITLLIEKLQKFSLKDQTVLKFAACLGNRFNLKTLAIVYKHSTQETLADLWQAIQQGLVLPLDNNYKLLTHTTESIDSYFKFLHDRVQQAAYSLIEPMQRQPIHLKIGQLLLENSSANTLEEMLFEILYHLNESITLIKELEKRTYLATLNLKAAKKAKLATAYELAEQYLTFCLQLLPQDTWKTQYTLTFEVYKTFAEISFLRSQFEQAEQYTQLLLTRAQSPLEKVQVYLVQLEQYQLIGQFEMQLDIGKKALALLDIHLPTTADELQAFIKTSVEEITLTMQGRNWTEIIDTPTVINVQVLTTMQIINNMLIAAFVVGNPLLLGTISAKQTLLSLQHGNSSFSSCGYVIFAITKLEFFDDIQGAIEFGQFAMTVMNQFQDKYTAGRTLMFHNIHLAHWNQPMRQLTKEFEKGFHYSMESGDLGFAGFNLAWKILTPFFCGENLNVVHNDALDALKILKKTGNFAEIVIQFAVVQAILQLQGKTLHLETLSSAEFSEEEVWKNFGNIPLFAAWFYGTKVRSFYLFERYQAVLDIYPQFHLTEILVSHQTFYPELYFYNALAITAVYSEASSDQQIEYGQRLQDFSTKIQAWADIYPPNFGFFHLLLQAEIARISGKIVEALRFYDQAIHIAEENDFAQFEALANELAAKFWLSQNKLDFASLYLTKAYHLYNFWGAIAKTVDLAQKYPHLLIKSSRSGTIKETITATFLNTATTAFTLGKSDLFDLSAVMKASQAISKEIVLEQLLRKLIQIVIENAGAQSGLLILKEAEQFWIKAEGGIYLQEVNIFESLPLASVQQDTLIPTTVVNYVIRTQKEVILNEATESELFKADPYIAQQHPKSVLCLPISYQGQVIGVLYFENNLISHAFTEDRLTILKLLSSQIAISLQNALLYKQHEKARQEAELANRAKSVFLSNMSHELRTPLNAILGYAQILDFNKTLNAEQREGIDVIKRSGEYLLMLINDILDISKIETGRFQLQPHDFNFDKFLKTIEEMFWIRAKQKKITFIFERLSALPGGIYGDEKRLRQILVNLLDNAVKFTKRGGVCLKVGYAEVTEQIDVPRKIRFQIEDTGIGIAQEKIGEIFLPFKQIDDDKQWTAGMGLGLFMTRKLIEMMGGELQVSSTLGSGSTFWTELMLEEIPHFIEARTKKEPIIMGYEGAKRTILVVDDVLENRLVVINLLEPFGFGVVEACDGREGLVKAQSLRPDLILMDFVMPVMDGFEATRQIKKIPALEKIPIIAASASVFDNDRREGIAAGCDTFIAKPFRASVLLDLLQKHLELTWIYQAEEEKIEPVHELEESIEQTLVGPTPSDASTLFELAMMGDIKGVVQLVERLEQANENLVPFANQVRYLAKEFKEEQICDLVERFTKQK